MADRSSIFFAEANLAHANRIATMGELIASFAHEVTGPSRPR
jgi:hypothetical protein